MPEFSWGDARPLDAIVGSFEDARKEDPIAEEAVVHRLAVFVDGTSDADTMGLADDVSLLIEAFVRDPASFARETPAGAPTPDADPEPDLDIALNGLNLGPEDQRVLDRLIRDLVRERRAPGGTKR